MPSLCTTGMLPPALVLADPIVPLSHVSVMWWGREGQRDGEWQGSAELMALQAAPAGIWFILYLYWRRI